MSSEFVPSVPQSFRLFNNGERVLVAGARPSSHAQPTQSAAVGKPGAEDAYPELRFHNLSLDELSAELDRRTKETQRLQEEVENATKLTLQRFGCSIYSSPGQNCHNHSFNVYDSARDSSFLSTKQNATVCDLESLNQTGAQREICSPREELFENEIDDCLHQLCDLQLSKTQTPAQPEQETFSVDTAVVKLQSELHKVQMEKDGLSDLRLKDSRTHVVQMEKMLHMLEELQNIKKAGDQKLQETEEETLVLNTKVETLERHVKEMYHTLLSHQKQNRHDIVTSPNNDTPDSPHLKPVTDGTESLKNETHELHEGTYVSHRYLWSGENSGANNQKERIEDVIASLGQEVVLLTDKLGSSKNNSINLSAKLDLLKELAERQSSVHQGQLSELQSTLCSHKDKVCGLEQQLIQAQSQLVESQRERARSLQQTEKFQSQLSQLKKCGEKQQYELQEEVKVLGGRLEAAMEQLIKGGEERSCLEALLEQRAQEGRLYQELLEKKTQELHFRQQESQQLLVRLEEAQRQCQALRSERETLRLQLDSQERKIDVLRMQMESGVQMTAQNSRTIDNLHEENSLLSNQLNQHKADIQQLRAEVEQSKSDLAAAEQERQRLQASVADQTRRVQEETLKKQKLTSQLEAQRTQFLTLTEEHQQLHQLFISQSEEHEGAVLKLQSQLRNTQNKLDQVKSTLRTLEGADGHGLQVAMEMQKQITNRREQIDSLQSKIQHLEELMEKLHQEKRQQGLQHQQQLQELTFIREEKKQLCSEMDALCSKDKQLRERISQLEAILHKMSESFADCRDFIQQQEQEFFRLKLRHALDLKELQGQNVTSPSDVDSPSPSAVPAPPSSQHASNAHRTKESSVRESGSLVKQLRGVISGDHRPHAENSAARSSFFRRRSAPEREHRTPPSTDKNEEIKAAWRWRRKTCGSEARVLKTAELIENKINGKPFIENFAVLSPANAAGYIYPPQGRRSPVHSLLTSHPNSQQ